MVHLDQMMIVDNHGPTRHARVCMAKKLSSKLVDYTKVNMLRLDSMKINQMKTA